ncbi:MAG: thiamine diphosphokinase [Clostridia bacterium]|nr:thiamine diphosphokinase [Clostridia bacterium]
MRAFIYAGGRISPDNITEHPKSGDLTIAADSGLRNAKLLGERVDIMLGDMDSLGDTNIPEGAERLNFPPEKDLTDTQLAVEAAIVRGADDIVIVGGLDGRLDHTLSVMGILVDLYERGIHAIALSGDNRIRYIKSTSTLLPRSGYKYLSLLAADAKVKGVSVEGCKYPLSNATLTTRLQFAVSNEITENCALVSVKKGGLFIVESRDAKQ